MKAKPQKSCSRSPFQSFVRNWALLTRCLRTPRLLSRPGLLLCLATLLPALHAQELPHQSLILVIDGARSNDDYRATLRNTIYDLLENSFQNHLRNNDAVVLLALGDSTRNQQFANPSFERPLAVSMAIQARDWLINQPAYSRFESQSIWPLLQTTLPASPVQWIVLFTDGRSPIQGTPFDSAIQAFLKENLKEQQKANRPFILTFLLEQQQWKTWSATLSGSPLNIPKPTLTTSPTSPPQ